MSKRFGFWPHITRYSVNFQRNKAFVGLSDYRTIGLSDYRSDPGVNSGAPEGFAVPASLASRTVEL